MSIAGRFTRLAAATVAVTVLVTMAAAQSWEKNAIKNKFGEATGQWYWQAVKAELLKNEHPNNRGNKWELGVADYGVNVVVITISPSPSLLGLLEGLPVSISLKDANGKVQEFEGATNPSASSTNGVAVICSDINLAKALDVNTKYKIVVEGVYPGDKWAARGEIVGNSLGAPMRAQWENKKKIEEEKKAKEEEERLAKEEEERLAEEKQARQEAEQERIRLEEERLAEERRKQQRQEAAERARQEQAAEAEQARQEEERAEAERAKQAEQYIELGIAAHNKGHFEDAIKSYNRALLMKPNDTVKEYLEMAKKKKKLKKK